MCVCVCVCVGWGGGGGEVDGAGGSKFGGEILLPENLKKRGISCVFTMGPSIQKKK